MKDNMDILLEKALTPDMEPGTELNNKILNGSKERKKHMGYKLAKVAAVLLGVALASPLAIYAAEVFKNKVTVTDHAVSVGNPDYIIDEAIAEPLEDIPVEKVDHVEGDDTVNWLYKDVEKHNEVNIVTSYTYETYEQALADANMANWFSKSYELNGYAYYSILEFGENIEYSIDAEFKYNQGVFSITNSRMTGNVADDMAYSIGLSNTGNIRNYTSPSGMEFTLVDETTEDEDGKVVKTYVIISYDDYNGFIEFVNLSEEEIHQILDTMLFAVEDDEIQENPEEEITEEPENTEE